MRVPHAQVILSIFICRIRTQLGPHKVAAYASALVLLVNIYGAKNMNINIDGREMDGVYVLLRFIIIVSVLFGSFLTHPSKLPQNM